MPDTRLAVVTGASSGIGAATARALAKAGFEVALGANLRLDLDVLAPHGVVATYADDPLPDVPVRELMVANAVLRFVLVYGVADADLDAAAEGVAQALADGVLPALPPVRFPLEQVARVEDVAGLGPRDRRHDPLSE